MANFNYRAPKSGLAREAQAKDLPSWTDRRGPDDIGRDIEKLFEIDNNFDVAEARKCLEWIQAITGEKISIEDTEDKKVMKENMFENLKDGFLLCRLINELSPEDQKLDFSKKAFQPSNNPVFKAAKDRERIGIFLEKVSQYGVTETNRFQTDYLYEKNNLVQVCICIRALGMEAQSREGYPGPYIWPKKALEHKRSFSEEQMSASKQVISLQYGTNKGASQAGMNFGKKRMIID